ncbi:hypothetical protein SAMN04487996_119107 [Dyadobacter soli]|uniref:Uncharacterized protein n=1 Tax=Dyadobacter soli TaxID=659014 RepID=A0A1G7UTX0_9BACT|nr:hypothetical protein SAMN04487996_119107 [Dyadobacter soli]
MSEWFANAMIEFVVKDGELFRANGLLAANGYLNLSKSRSDVILVEIET